LRQQYEACSREESAGDDSQTTPLGKSVTLSQEKKISLSLALPKTKEDATKKKVKELFMKTNYSCFKALGQLKELVSQGEAFLKELQKDEEEALLEEDGEDGDDGD